jgi:hypothetical protein
VQRSSGRSAAHVVFCLDVRATVQQQLHHAQVAVVCSVRQWRPTGLRAARGV